MPSNPPLSIAESALLVIDVQDSFKALPRWERRNNPAFEENVARLIQSYRDADLPVVFVLHTAPDGPFDSTSPHFKLMDFVDRRESDSLFVKNTRNAFTSTDLKSFLDERAVRRLVVTGIQTEQCCETTTRLAGDLGYDVDFVTEATLTFPIAYGDDELSTADIVRNTEFVLRDRFARIARVADIVAETERPTAAWAT